MIISKYVFLYGCLLLALGSICRAEGEEEYFNDLDRDNVVKRPDIDQLVDQRSIDLMKMQGLRPDEVSNNMKQMRIFREMYRVSDTSISFYGKIIDQYGKGVAGADVKISIKYFYPIPGALGVFQRTRQIAFLTDAEGCFQIENMRGSTVYVDKITKPGYEFTGGQNPQRSFEQTPSPNAQEEMKRRLAKYGIDINPKKGREVLPQKTIRSNDANPVIFRLTKRGMKTPAILNNSTATPIKDDKIELIPRDVGDNENAQAKWPGLHLLRVEPADAADMIFTFEGKSDEYLYQNSPYPIEEVPEKWDHSYLTRAHVRVPMDGQYHSNTIVVNRKQLPSMYCVAMISICVFTKDKYDIKFESITNPYGDRNLNPIQGLPDEIAKRLRKEAKEAWKKGMNPQYPADMQKLSEMAKPVSIDRGGLGTLSSK
jgi:hypothetical protein